MSEAPPIFVFAAPNCGASPLAAMLGRHSGVYALPELNLFLADEVGELLAIADLAFGLVLDGLLRSIAALAFGGQRDADIVQARQWLEERRGWPIAQLLRQLQHWAHPRRLLVPDTQAPLRPVDLQRCVAAAPEALHVHLRRHPYTQGCRFAAILRERQFVPPDYKDHRPKPARIDPQIPWLRANENLLRVTRQREASLCVDACAEALEGDVAAGLTALCERLGLHVDARELARMRDFRAWPFWNLGPPLAPLGLETEAYRMDDARQPKTAEGAPRLDAVMPWSRERAGFAPEVRRLAAEFGYR